MQSKNILVGAVVVLVVILVAVLLKGKLGLNGDAGAYSVVQTTTGQVYVGRLNKVSGLELTDAYLYQATKDPKDPEKTTYQLQSIKEALWAPKSIRFVKENVVFYGELSPQSAIAKKLAEQQK